MLDSLDTLIAFVLILLVVSLLITIVVQMFTAVFNLRGVNLVSALGSTFAVIAPSLEDKRKELARYVLRGRLLSDSCFKGLGFWRTTAAVRPGELFDAIQRIAIGKEPATEKLKNNAQSVLLALGVNLETIEGARKNINNAEQQVNTLKAQANGILQSMDDNTRQHVQDAINDAVKAIEDKLRVAGTAAANQIVAAAGTISAGYQKFEYWMCISQERAEQWLTMHTRVLTIIFAFIFAFGLQLDTVEIFKLVSSNKAVREKLVAQATAVSSQAEKILGDSPTILQSAYNTWLGNVKDPSIKSALTSPPPGPVKIAANDNRENVAGQIENALARFDNKSKEDTLKSFNQAVDKTVTDALEKKSRDYREVQANFKNTGFDLFPNNPNNMAFTRWGDNWSRGCLAHVLGIFFSVGLLSLGAPFWYHSLKDLVSLRSQVAQNMADEKEQKQKQPDGTKPPTVKFSEDLLAAVNEKLGALSKAQTDPEKVAAIDALKALAKRTTN